MDQPQNKRRYTPGLAVDLYRRLCRSRAFMDANCCLDLDLDEIAAQANLSTFHFLRLFRMTFKKTPHRYLVERRIEKARGLLASTDMRVTDICFEVGFESLGSFSTLFRKCVGQSPAEYRNRQVARQSSPLSQIPGCFRAVYASGSSGLPSSPV